MKKTILLLLAVSVLLSGCAQESDTISETQFETGIQATGLELAMHWELLSIMAIIVSVILVAIAYVIGMGLEMPEIRAWANNELVQIIANTLIVVLLIVSIAFIDVLVVGMVMTSGLDIQECGDPGQSCLQAVTVKYLDQYVVAAKDGAKSALQNNVDAAGMAARRLGLYCTTIYCLQLGFTTTIAGNYALDVDFYSIIFEYYVNLLSSMEAQRFFVEQVSFRMAPVLLAIGVVARAFYFTRKLGGLLIAVAVGVMFFFPGMYIFDWLTLETALTGDKGIGDEVYGCPPECGIAPPIAYIEGTGEGLNTIKDVYEQFPGDTETAEGIIKGYTASAIGAGGTVKSCFIPKKGFMEVNRCEIVCRELPYPSSVPVCATLEAQSDCAKLPVQCKAIRYVSEESMDLVEYSRCPDSCKVVPPLKSDCSDPNPLCLASSFDCRVTYNTGDPPPLTWRPTKQTDDFMIQLQCAWASHCPASLVAEESCVWVVPQTGSCDTLCLNCPEYCRVETATPTAECAASAASCALCPESCSVKVSDISALPGNEECEGCPPEKRIIASWLPDSYRTGACDPGICVPDSEHRMRIPRNTCETCLFTEESYAYKPPIQARCSDLCKPPDNAPVKEAGSYMKVGAEGFVGRPEIRDLAKLMLPAYILPLFNIVATLVFIKGFSALIGGDIEIPGISKVF